jgi:hypothetical protein
MQRRVCVPREALGIIASARAVMYYAGRSQRVHLDMVKELAKNGTDIIFVEKECIVDVLTSYADEYGIALVKYTRTLDRIWQRFDRSSKESRCKCGYPH